MEKDTEIIEIAQHIFVGEPKEPFSIRLLSEHVDHEYVFTMISNLLLEGLYIMYGTMLDVTKLTDVEFVKINEYMKSFGFSMEKKFGKENESYCYMAKTPYKDRPYVFVISNQQLESKKTDISEYYINIGEFQLSIHMLVS